MYQNKRQVLENSSINEEFSHGKGSTLENKDVGHCPHLCKSLKPVDSMN